MRFRHLWVGLVVGSMLLFVFAHGAAATSNPQIVFSSTSSLGDPGPLKPFGFWIWCYESVGSNPYVGECGGTMYFYGTAVGAVVDNGPATVSTAGKATISVQSTSGVGPAFACTLSGPIGMSVTVTVTCPSGPRTGTNTMPFSVVALTPAS